MANTQCKKQRAKIDAKELWQEVVKAKNNGLEPTERYGDLMIAMTELVLKTRSFCRYPQPLQEDMQIFAFERLIKALRPIKPGEGSKEDIKRVFNYLYRTVWNAFLTTVMKFYKQQNIKRKLFAEYLDRQEHLDARTKERL